MSTFVAEFENKKAMIVVMLTLFALVVVGFVAGKLGYLGGDFDRQLSRLVINITCPALILSSAMTGELPDRQYILPLLLISARRRAFRDEADRLCAVCHQH